MQDLWCSFIEPLNTTWEESCVEFCAANTVGGVLARIWERLINGPEASIGYTKDPTSFSL